MAYSLLYSKQAEKYLNRLNRSKAISILKRIHYVSLDPMKEDNNIVKLAGTGSSYRLRIGDMRVVYQLDQRENKIYILKIASRGSIYSY